MGHCGDTLRPLVEVEKYRLCVGQMFPDKNIFWMRIAEEALLHGITVHAIRSEYTHLTVCGQSFHAEGTYREGLGWTCKVAVCCDGDDTSIIPDRSRHDNTNVPLKTPLYYEWVILIIRSRVEKKPGIEYEALRDALRPYARETAITNFILQKARDVAKIEIFGSPNENVWYVEGVLERMRSLGHTAELV
jgi:hypothetical protein